MNFKNTFSVEYYFQSTSKIIVVPSYEGGNCLMLAEVVTEKKDTTLLQSLKFLNKNNEINEFFKEFKFQELCQSIDSKKIIPDELASIILWTVT